MVLGLLVALELFQAPLTFRQAPVTPAAYRWLAVLPRGPVAEFPFFADHGAFPGHAEYMLGSAQHWQPLINGYSNHIPPDFRAIAGPLSTFPSREAFAVLRQRQARYAVVHVRMYDEPDMASLMARLDEFMDYLRPLAGDEDAWLYEIVAFPRD